MKKKGWLYVAIISFILLLVLKSDTLLTVLGKFVINNFAGGRSDFKFVTFFIYFSLSSLLLFLSFNGKTKRIEKFIKNKPVKIYFLVTLLIVFLVGVASFFVFINEFGLDSSSYYKTIYEGRQSSTQITHIHTYKATLSKMVDFVNPNLHRGYDAGRFFAENLPAFFWIFGLFALPLLMILSFLVLLNFKEQLKQNKHQSFFIVIYLISSFSSMKNTFDGGLLNPETFVWLSVLVAVLYHHKTITLFIKKSIIFLSGSLLLLISILFVFGVQLKPVLVDYLSCAVFFLFITGIYVTFSKRDFLVSAIIVAGYCLFVLLVFSSFSSSYYHYTLDRVPELTEMVPAGSQGFVYLLPTQEEVINNCENIIYQQDDVTICRFVTDSPQLLSGVFNQYTSLPVNFFSVTVEGVNCAQQQYSKTHKFILVEGEIPGPIQTNLMDFTFSTTNETIAGRPIYSYSIEAVGCIPDFSDVKQRILNKEGMKSYILLN